MLLKETMVTVFLIDLTDMTKLAQTYPNNQTQERSQLLRSIKNNMTDRHIVNTCLKHV
jgi:hypothetical protein